MKKYFHIKILTLLFFIALIAFLGNMDFFVLGLNKPVDIAKADTSYTGGTCSGWAWSSNYGWISMNCANEDSCGLVDYGVGIKTNNNFFGYAWSPNIGWINFDLVKKGSEGSVTGDAIVTALGETNGKLKMSGSWDSGVSIDSDGAFSGYAWNGNSDGSGIGWVDFSGVSCPPDKEILIAPEIIKIEDVSGLCGSVMVTWSDNSESEIGFLVERKMGSEDVWQEFCEILEENITACTSTLFPNTTYSFRVKALGSDDNDSEWSEERPHKTGMCSPENLRFTEQNCDRVVLEWDSVEGAENYRIERSENGGEFSEIGQAENLSYTDNNIGTRTTYKYKVIAINSESEEVESSETEEIEPCPAIPIWREIRSR